MSSVALGQYVDPKDNVAVALNGRPNALYPSTSVSIQPCANDALVSVPVAAGMTTSPEMAFVCFATKDSRPPEMSLKPSAFKSTPANGFAMVTGLSFVEL